MSPDAGAETGRKVLVIGAEGGLGAAIAAAYAAQGAALARADLAPTAPDALALDVTDAASVAAGFETAATRLGGLDVVINAAGVLHAPAPLRDLSEAEFDRAYAVNARGAFLCLRAALRAMTAAPAETDRAILTIASVAGLVGAPMLGGYAASKHAVVGLTRTAADEAARFGVRVNALCPSFAETPMLESLGPAADDVSKLTRRIPLRRLASPEEVAAAARWICSAENRFMTGQAIALDGGLTAI
ncbi:MAG: SDR family oxidoreductase [Pseudomonadota bacterium]